MLVISLICWAYLACFHTKSKGNRLFLQIQNYWIFCLCTYVCHLVYCRNEYFFKSNIYICELSESFVLCQAEYSDVYHLWFCQDQIPIRSSIYLYKNGLLFLQISIRIRPQPQLYACIISAKFGPNCNCFFLNNYQSLLLTLNFLFAWTEFNTIKM